MFQLREAVWVLGLEKTRVSAVSRPASACGFFSSWLCCVRSSLSAEREAAELSGDIAGAPEGEGSSRE